MCASAQTDQKPPIGKLGSDWNELLLLLRILTSLFIYMGHDSFVCVTFFIWMRACIRVKRELIVWLTRRTSRAFVCVCACAHTCIWEWQRESTLWHRTKIYHGPSCACVWIYIWVKRVSIVRLKRMMSRVFVCMCACACTCMWKWKRKSTLWRRTKYITRPRVHLYVYIYE